MLFSKSKDQTGEVIKDGLRRTKPLATYDENDSILLEHQRLAAKLGVRTISGTGVRALVSVLEEIGARIYDFDQVEAFMTKKAEDARREWHWYPLRASDQNVIRTQDTERRRIGDYSWSRDSGSFSTQLYPEIVPLPVLMTADSIVEKLGDKVSFYVAALGEKIDPFLGVRLKSAPDQMFVVERWDEPSFR